MKLINKNTDYAIKALCFIAKQKGIISVGELSKRLSIPRPFLRRILQMLNKADILTSYKGKKGGFKLCRDSKDIYVKELIEIFQGPLLLSNCFIGNKLCYDFKSCPLRKKIKKIERDIIKKIQKLTIASLIGNI